MSKHQGPWTAKELGGAFDEPRWVILWPDKSKGGVHMRRLDDHGELDKEDAQVMAAAPELLEMLLALECDINTMAYCYDKRPENFWRAMAVAKENAILARAVIAKAKGTADAPS